MGGGFYRLINTNSGKALDVARAGTQDGADVIQWSAHGGANQGWRIEDVGSGYFKLTAQHSGKCLDVNDASAAQGANVQQWTDKGTAAQRWRIEAQ